MRVKARGVSPFTLTDVGAQAALDTKPSEDEAIAAPERSNQRTWSWLDVATRVSGYAFDERGDRNVRPRDGLA